jgi:hypothetical protein
MNFIYTLILILFFTNIQATVIVNSVIRLKDNIPEECGLAFVDKDRKFNGELVIKKHDSQNTLTVFSVIHKDLKVKSANLKTFSIDISKILEKENLEKDSFKIESITKNNDMTKFFQEILISGGRFLINNESYEIIGPIDSKVRLEYLFCTGEMFLPNYERK